MTITRVYQNNSIDVSKLRAIRDYLNLNNSKSLGPAWGHKIYRYVLHYGIDDVVECQGVSDVEKVVGSRGETRKWSVHFESRTGRLLTIDATNSTRIKVEAINGDYTLAFLSHVEQLLELTPIPRRIFVSHGRSLLWLEVQRYVEKDAGLGLEVVELTDEPNRGRTISQKLQEEARQCSYAIIVMTGDDLTSGDDVRVRENVMHEIGYFQGRYGYDRVCLLRQKGVNIASNLIGLVYHGFEGNKIRAAFADLQKELRAAFQE